MVLATTAAFTFSSYILAKLEGLLGLTESEAMTLDLLLLSPLVSLPILVIVLAQSDYAFSRVRATIALFAGHLRRIRSSSLHRSVLSGQNGFPSADERRLVILYGYLGWCIGPLVTTLLLLMLSRRQSVTSQSRSGPLSNQLNPSATRRAPRGALLDFDPYGRLCGVCPHKQLVLLRGRESRGAEPLRRAGRSYLVRRRPAVQRPARPRSEERPYFQGGSFLDALRVRLLVG